MKKLIIAVDGTSGSGKSITFKKVAEIVNYQFIDTGLMYRALTWYCLFKKIDYKNPDNVIELLREFDYQVDKRTILVNKIDVTNKLQDNQIVNAINYISVIPQVREFMVEKQRNMVKNGGCIEIGRDITSIVLPNADLKIFLDSQLEIRAKRRFDQNQRNNIQGKTYKQIKKDLEQRDYIDKNRKTGPLVLVKDAWYIDNSYLSIDQVVELVVNKIKELERTK